jgi:hypothetical protein
MPLHVARRTGTLAVAFGLSILAAACGTKDADGPLQPNAPFGRVRYVNLNTDTTRGRVNAILEGLPFGVNLTNGMATPASLPAPATAFYSPIYAGSRTLVLKRTIDTSVTVATIPFTVTANADQTIYSTGGAGATPVVPVIIADDNTAPAATEVRFRIVNMSDIALDVFITANNADLSAATPTVAALAVQTASSYITLPAGSYQIRMVPAGTAAGARAANVVITVANAAYAGGTGRTIVATTSTTGGLPRRGIVLGDR